MNDSRLMQRPLSRRTLVRGIGAAGGAAMAGGFIAPARRVVAQEAVTLTIWDNFTRPVESTIVDTLNQEFQDAHPGLTIERVTKSFDDLKATARLALSADDGPDVAQINQGLSDMGAMVKAGVLKDLGPYATQFGWDQKLSAGVIARNSFTEDGVTFGEGNLYGMPVTAEFIGVYYNKTKFADLGVEVPATFADYEALLAQALDAGEIPIAFGNLDAWPAIHNYGEIQNLWVDRTTLDDFIFGRGDSTFATPENEQAAAKLQAWVEAGYFTPDYAGIGYDDSWQAYADGQGVTMTTGSWISGELFAKEVDADFGFFLTPPETAGTPKLSVAGTSMGFAIREGSANPDLAAEYIDWLVSDRAVELWTEAQIVHIGVNAEAVEPGTIYADLVNAWTTLNETDTVGHYLDWATPTFYDTLTAALQELLAMAVTPAEFTQNVEEDYAAYLAEKGA
ncbi:MAG: extracellular solute-binding protein [Chloroflexota bacterium]|nr:extracellular solute-binding protein [Chloroflexota bacterium]